jgi:photosystem II stability/assembly factor-like uncharacterized protein
MSESYGYGQGSVLKKNHFFVSGVNWAMEDDNVEHGVIFEYDNKKWSAWSVDFRVAGIASTPNGWHLFVVGQKGTVETTGAADAWDETIDASDAGPSSVRPINDVQVVGDYVFAVGSRRQVYRRHVATRQWDRFDKGCLVPPTSRDIRAFMGLHGNKPDELYAVGLQGEIWCCRNGVWRQLDSPTNVALDLVFQRSNGEILVGGPGGVLLSGNASGFAYVETGVDEGFVSAAEIAGRTWLATQQGNLFEWTDGRLSAVNVPIESDEGGGHVACADGVLLFVRHDAVGLFDGKKWKDVTPPDDA